MRRILTVVFAVIGVSATGVAGLACWGLRHSEPPLPVLSGQIERGTIEHDGRTRSWRAYVPIKRAPSPPLVIVLHSSMGSAQQAREMFGYDFDVLADEHAFIVVSPTGVEGHWNEAKIKGPFLAKRQNIDDVGFLHALVDDLVGRYRVDRSHVYVTGVSNGGSMVLRLALETPTFARAYAAVVASVPAATNMAASPKQQAVSMLLMNGTADPFNPWNGGDVALHGVWGNRGAVLSTPASIDYFRGLAGLDVSPEVAAFPDRDSSDGSAVERSVWTDSGKPRVVLYAIKGGGHDVPHPATYGRRLLGHSNRDIHAAREIWAFFVSAS
jgi:polyhydroxybutyrate depolymerase